MFSLLLFIFTFASIAYVAGRGLTAYFAYKTRKAELQADTDNKALGFLNKD